MVYDIYVYDIYILLTPKFGLYVVQVVDWKENIVPLKESLHDPDRVPPGLMCQSK